MPWGYLKQGAGKTHSWGLASTRSQNLMNKETPTLATCLKWSTNSIFSGWTPVCWQHSRVSIELAEWWWHPQPGSDGKLSVEEPGQGTVLCLFPSVTRVWQCLVSLHTFTSRWPCSQRNSVARELPLSWTCQSLESSRNFHEHQGGWWVCLGSSRGFWAMLCQAVSETQGPGVGSSLQWRCLVTSPQCSSLTQAASRPAYPTLC